MKKIILMRHAKSSWDLPVSDIQRPLNERGLKNAPEMGRRILKSKIVPELIFSSNAVRALSTAQLIRDAIHPNIPVEIEPKIYDSTLQILLKIIENFPNDKNTIMIIGHNPTISLLANYLSRENIGYFSTATMACLDFDVDNWNEITGGSGKVLFFDFPKNENSPFI